MCACAYHVKVHTCIALSRKLVMTKLFTDNKQGKGVMFLAMHVS
jgi:hypothetical protein